MAKTAVADIIIPTEFEKYAIERTAELSAFGQSGIVESAPEFDELAMGGGREVKMPFWKDLTAARQILSDSGTLAVNKIAAEQDIARIHNDAQVWSVNHLAKVISGKDALECRDDQAFVRARPILGHQIDDRLHGIIAGDHLGEMVHAPHLGVVVNASDVLVAGDCVDGERGAVAEKLPRRGQVFPERHFDFAPAAHCDFVELRCHLHDAALAELRQFGGALDGVFLKLRWDDDVCYRCLGHNEDL